MTRHETVFGHTHVLSSPSICSKCFRNNIWTIINHLLIKEKCVSGFVITISKRYCWADFLFFNALLKKNMCHSFFICVWKKVFVFSINCIYIMWEVSLFGWVYDMLGIRLHQNENEIGYHCPRFLVLCFILFSKPLKVGVVSTTATVKCSNDPSLMECLKFVINIKADGSIICQTEQCIPSLWFVTLARTVDF